MTKIFITAFIRDLDEKVAKGEISYSRMVEILNEKANEAIAAEKQRWVEKIENRINELDHNHDHTDLSSDPEQEVADEIWYDAKRGALEKLLEGEK